MGDWSEYFEDFPEENPANQINGIYYPPNSREREEKELQEGLRQVNQQLRKLPPTRSTQ
jgi:hypothetical protein